MKKKVKKSDSTYFKLEKAIDDLDKSINQRSSQDEINEILKIANESTRQINELIDFHSIKSVNQQMAEFYEQLREVQHIHKNLTQLYNQTGTSILDQIHEQLKAVDFRQISFASLFIDKYEMEHLHGLVIDLSDIHTEFQLDEISKFKLEINEFRQLKPSNQEYLLNTKSSFNKDFGYIQFNTFQNTQLKIDNLQKDVKDIKTFVYEDAENKDKMLQQLLDYLKSNRGSKFKIKKILYDKKSPQLIINQNIVDLSADTNQHYICSILFSSKKNMKKVWEIYDIVEQLGEDVENLNKWKGKIYDTIRHLNIKIEQKTGIKEFIIYSNKTVVVNPNYTDSI